MKTRTLILGSVASLSLAGTLMLISPSFGQDANNPPQYSTPAEKAQTQQLNQDAAGGTPADQASPQQSQYDQQQQDYQQKKDDYQRQQDRYHAEHAQYEHNIHRYDEARFYFTDYPHAYPYRYEDAHLTRLYLIADPTHQLANVPIEGPNGEWVGKVRNIETAVDGRPQRVEVALNRRVSVYVSPGALRFDPENHVLYTNLTRADLWDMPGSTFESGRM